MNSPLVTVLIPAYNAGPYLLESLESVFAQDFQDFELLVIDDGSTDYTDAVLASVTDPRLRVLRQDNTGLVGALNRGLVEARGEFLARMDADDRMGVGRLSAQLKVLTADPSIVSCGTDYEMFGAITGRVRMPRTDAACRQRLLFGTCHCGASVMIRRSILSRSGLEFRTEFAHAEDYRMFAELSEFGRLANVPMVGYEYRIYPNQVSAVHGSQQRIAHQRIAREYAISIGVKPLPDEDLATLLWPHVPAGSLPVAVMRALADIARPAATAVARRPGIETVRFTGLKVVETLAKVRAAH